MAKRTPEEQEALLDKLVGFLGDYDTEKAKRKVPPPDGDKDKDKDKDQEKPKEGGFFDWLFGGK
jgi:hypothetical protein